MGLDEVNGFTGNVGILAAFAIQHTIMARPAYKAAWKKVLPESMDRSTFVILTSLILTVLCMQWRPISGALWNIHGETARWILTAISLGGFGIVLYASFLIDHFDLFGLRQVFMRFRNVEYTKPEFRETSLYRYVRHPIMLGFVIAFWATPHMTWSQFLFAGVTTAYILVGTRFEERDLLAEHGESYEKYRARVPMILPLGGKKAK